ncbi:hypothetical protein RJ641_004902 [Dillenia turbinata]|uniref:Uncharacterized protein n=1 Tax=Dillenia turbinata TaxID=194707 RepID=A0AAN8Z8H3_9MAGN
MSLSVNRFGINHQIKGFDTIMIISSLFIPKFPPLKLSKRLASLPAAKPLGSSLQPKLLANKLRPLTESRSSSVSVLELLLSEKSEIYVLSHVPYKRMLHLRGEGAYLLLSPDPTPSNNDLFDMSVALAYAVSVPSMQDILGNRFILTSDAKLVFRTQNIKEGSGKLYSPSYMLCIMHMPSALVQKEGAYHLATIDHQDSMSQGGETLGESKKLYRQKGRSKMRPREKIEKINRQIYVHQPLVDLPDLYFPLSTALLANNQ